MTPKSSEALIKARRKFHEIENFITKLIKDGKIHSEGIPTIAAKPLRMPKIKRMEMSVAMNHGWVSVQGDAEENPFDHFRFSDETKYLKEFILKYRG